MTKPHFSLLATSFAGGPRPRNAATTLAVLWLLLYCPTSLPLIPQSITIALLALLGHRWANQAFGARTAFYTAIAVLTSFGVFLHTRTLHREVFSALLLSAALFAFLKALNPDPSRTSVGSDSLEFAPTGSPIDQSRLPQVPLLGHRSEFPQTPVSEQPSIAWYAGPHFYPYAMWFLLAAATFTSGPIAPILFLLTTLLYLYLTQTFPDWRRLKPFTGLLLFLAVTIPTLLFIHPPTSFRGPRLPDYTFWPQHLLWLFPWTLFLPLALAATNRRMRHQTVTLTRHIPKDYSWAGAFLVVGSTLALFGVSAALNPHHVQQFVICLILVLTAQLVSRRVRAQLPPSPFHRIDPQQRSILLLSLFAAVTLLVYSFAPNSNSSTLPAYLPILLLLAATITRAEQTYSTNPSARRWLTFAHATLTLSGLALTTTLAYALWTHHQILNTTIPGVPATFAILIALLGPTIAWLLRTQRRHLAATTAIAVTSAALLAALYFVR